MPVLRSTARAAALVLDLAAVVGLVLVVTAMFRRGDAFVLLVPGVLLGLAAIPGAVLSAVVLVQEATARGVPRRRSTVLAAALSACAVAVGPAGAALGWALTPNPAADRAAPVLRGLEREGAERICASGDAGRGPDNVTAWQTVYYRAPAGASTPAALHRVFAAHGRSLGPAVPDDDIARDALRLTAARTAAPGSLSVVTAAEPVTLLCTVDGVYGRAYRAPAGQRVLVVDSEAPPSG